MKTNTAYIFDFDETLVTTDAKIHVYRNGAFQRSMDSKEYNFYKPTPGDTYDFSDFKDGEMIMNAKTYKMWPAIRNVSNAIKEGRSTSEIYILTARAPISQSYIYEFLKSHGIEIKLNHIITIGDDAGLVDISNEKRKKLADLKKKYGKVVFFDDDPKNIALAAGIQGIKTRLVESSILEKFVEDSDSIEDMGIGIPYEIEKILRKEDTPYTLTDEGDIDSILYKMIYDGHYEYADYLIDKYGINVNDNNYSYIRALAFNNNFKALEYYVSKGGDVYAALKTAKILKEKFTIEGLNYFIDTYQNKNKKMGKFVKEEMGGVSAPMSTLNNTPGMGNVTPASTTSTGSGDKFGNVIGGKLYTQRTPLKKKTKKKKEDDDKELSEENINPYDKLGTSMAKKMGVKMPFKKKKSKHNQNAMTQKKFEHQIITLDEFINESKHPLKDARQ